MHMSDPFFGYSPKSPSPFKASPEAIKEWRLKYKEFRDALAVNFELRRLFNLHFDSKADAEQAIKPLERLARKHGIEIEVCEKSTVSLW